MDELNKIVHIIDGYSRRVDPSAVALYDLKVVGFEEDDGALASVSSDLTTRVSKKLLEMSDAEILGVLFHELLHPALNHFSRGHAVGAFHNQQLAELWNIACDLEINTRVGEVLPLPKSGVFPESVGLESKKWIAEEAFRELVSRLNENQNQSVGDGDEQSQRGSGDGKQNGSAGGDGEQDQQSSGKPSQGQPQSGRGSPTQMPAEAKDMRPSDDGRDQRNERLIEAIVARLAGTGIGNLIKEVIADAKRYDKSWERIVRAFVTRAIAVRGMRRIDDYSRPRRRPNLPGNDFIHPRQVVMRKPTLGVIVDTSGSMADAINDAVGVVASIAANYGGVLVMMMWDFGYQSHTIIQPNQRIDKIDVSGFGGTDMAKAMRYMLEELPAEDKRVAQLMPFGGLVIVTDGYTDWPDNWNTWHCPVLVILTKDGTREGIPDDFVVGVIPNL